MITEEIVMPYQFAFHDQVPKQAPPYKPFDNLAAGMPMSRDDKNALFHSLQGNSGKHNYRLSGWIYPFGQWMNTYLVKYKHYGWQEIKAFDKTCIRSSWYTNSGIIEILQKPE